MASEALLVTFLAVMAIVPRESVTQYTTDASADNYDSNDPVRQWINVFPNSSFLEFLLISHPVRNLSHFDTYPSTLVLNDNIRSVCGEGAWIFYTHFSFKGASELIKLKDGGCTNLAMEDVSSLRPAGDLYYFAKPTFTIYGGANYTENNWTYDHGVSHFVGQHQSIIITGTSSWGIYSQRSYIGDSMCLQPAIDKNVQVQGIKDHTVAPYNIVGGFIQSIRKGCTGKERRVVLVGFSSGNAIGLSGVVTLVWIVMSTML